MLLCKIVMTLWLIFATIGVFFINVPPNSKPDVFMSKALIVLISFTLVSIIYGLWG